MGRRETVVLCAICAICTGCAKRSETEMHPAETLPAETLPTYAAYGLQQVTKAYPEYAGYEMVDSLIEWSSNYSYVRDKDNASIYGFWGPIKGHKYYVVSENGYVYDMAISEDAAEVSCPDGPFAPDVVKSIWGVETGKEAIYTVWYEGG